MRCSIIETITKNTGLIEADDLTLTCVPQFCWVRNATILYIVVKDKEADMIPNIETIDRSFNSVLISCNLTLVGTEY